MTHCHSFFYDLFLHSNLQLCGQPFSYRFIIQFESRVCQHHIGYIYASNHLPCFAKRIKLVLDEPSIEQIHHRIMNNI